MKLKSLLFGSAAILAAGTGAQAADLPTAEPVEYVRICDAFGTGFFYIPGTDTCLAIGGMVRADFTYTDFDSSSDNANDNVNGRHREFNNYRELVRGEINLDARTQTDFGLIRAYIGYRMTLIGDNVGSSRYDIRDASNSQSTNPYLRNAFIQITNDWGTITAGRTSSFFDFFGSNTFGTVVSIDDITNEANLGAYTAAFGNGFSATIAIEDPLSNGRRYNTSYDVTDISQNGRFDIGHDTYEGQEYPDVVGNLRLDQGWGSAQIMGVLHGIHDKEGLDVVHNRADINTEGAQDEDGFGWAAGIGASVNLPFLNKSGLAFQATYGDGALGYVTGDPGGVGDFMGPRGDDTNTAWGIRAGLTLGFSPTVASYIDFSYTSVDAQESVVYLGGNRAAAIDADYDFMAVAANVVWTPVKGLSMGPEVEWREAPQYGGDNNRNNGFRPLEEDDVWGAMFRIQRNF